MIPFDDNGDDLQDTNATTDPTTWRCFWIAWATGEIPEPAAGALVRRWVREEVLDMVLVSLGMPEHGVRGWARANSEVPA